MVTTTSPATSLEQKRPGRKKPINTGIWPCKINGCNKQFAREADLKRHQRTTKMHSMPGFSCPQCDANFTRTDALRRHQKSRHNGIVIEPVLANPGDENVDGRSRSGTPSSKGKEKEVDNVPVQTHQGAATHAGPSSYYRSHTLNISPHIPKPSHSKTAPQWSGYPAIWQSGVIPPTGFVPYYPSPHYRPHTNGYYTVHPHATPYVPQVPAPPSSSSTSTSRNSSSLPPKSTSSQTSTTQSQSPPPTTSGTVSTPDPPDPGLDFEAETGITEADVVAAVQAVLMQAESEEAAKKQRLKEIEERERRAGGGADLKSPDANANSPLDDTSRFLDLDDHGMLHGYDRPEPMAHILTEDGEPMLNPAELLTQVCTSLEFEMLHALLNKAVMNFQESLASPPPS
ncbi:hypothetical protein CVT26_009121 [Gymnopilus dilepis]|uniref:C2H2-type domain-containing protein n=1 Tax=Gymnopilus dilepis TaxID=231916 RepID=A0A409YRG8_9AGAR|nr:hypothetical protein CVT26_009121 [Gymnopilus dilepis]